MGAASLAAGLTLLVGRTLAWSGFLNFLGRLPGDIRYESEHARIYVPWVTCLVVSAALSLLAALARKFL